MGACLQDGGLLEAVVHRRKQSFSRCLWEGGRQSLQEQAAYMCRTQLPQLGTGQPTMHPAGLVQYLMLWVPPIPHPRPE